MFMSQNRKTAWKMTPLFDVYKGTRRPKKWRKGTKTSNCALHSFSMIDFIDSLSIGQSRFLCEISLLLFLCALMHLVYLLSIHKGSSNSSKYPC